MANKRKSEGGGLGPHVVPLRAGRTTLTPAVQLIVAQWLVMLNARYTDALHSASNKYDGVSPLIKEGMRRRFSTLADASAVFLSDLMVPWSRVQWLKAGREVERLMAELRSDPDRPPIDTAPTGP